MCGHFQIPFFTFFIPTLIGKAINKVSIQVVFIIITFSKHMLDILVNFLSHFTSNADGVKNFINKQKKSVFKSQQELDEQEANTPIVKQLWEWFITLMILYFVVTFFNALVRNQLQQDAKEEKDKQEKGHQMTSIKKNKD